MTAAAAPPDHRPIRLTTSQVARYLREKAPFIRRKPDRTTVRRDDEDAANRQVPVWRLQCHCLGRAAGGQSAPLPGLPASLRRAMDKQRVFSGGSRPPRWSQQDIYKDKQRRDADQPPFLPDLWGDGLLDRRDRLDEIWHPGRGIQRSVIPRPNGVVLGRSTIRVVAAPGKCGSLGHATVASLRPLLAT